MLGGPGDTVPGSRSPGYWGFRALGAGGQRHPHARRCRVDGRGRRACAGRAARPRAPRLDLRDALAPVPAGRGDDAWRGGAPAAGPRAPLRAAGSWRTTTTASSASRAGPFPRLQGLEPDTPVIYVGTLQQDPVSRACAWATWCCRKALAPPFQTAHAELYREGHLMTQAAVAELALARRPLRGPRAAHAHAVRAAGARMLVEPDRSAVWGPSGCTAIPATRACTWCCGLPDEISTTWRSTAGRAARAACSRGRCRATTGGRRRGAARACCWVYACVRGGRDIAPGVRGAARLRIRPRAAPGRFASAYTRWPIIPTAPRARSPSPNRAFAILRHRHPCTYRRADRPFNPVRLGRRLALALVVAFAAARGEPSSLVPSRCPSATILGTARRDGSAQLAHFVQAGPRA